MQLVVSVVNQHDHLVMPEAPMSIGVTLLYGNLEEVQREKQHILKEINLADSKLFIDKHGSGKLNLRIEEVSSKHCSRSFIIRVHALNESEVAHALTSPVTVASKSKRTAAQVEGSRTVETCVQEIAVPSWSHRTVQQFAPPPPAVASTVCSTGAGCGQVHLQPEQLTRINAIISLHFQTYLRAQACTAHDGRPGKEVYVVHPQVRYMYACQDNCTMMMQVVQRLIANATYSHECCVLFLKLTGFGYFRLLDCVSGCSDLCGETISGDYELIDTYARLHIAHIVLIAMFFGATPSVCIRWSRHISDVSHSYQLLRPPLANQLATPFHWENRRPCQVCAYASYPVESAVSWHSLQRSQSGPYPAHILYTQGQHYLSGLLKVISLRCHTQECQWPL
jgi:hypothetical protein